MVKPRPEQLKGNTAALILAVLQREPLHGYAIARKIEGLTDAHLTLNEGSLYPTLHELERDGAAAAAWEAAGGRRRKVYRITKKGRAVLAELTAEWRRFATSVNRVLGAVGDG